MNLLAMLAETPWRPIEEAPKDGATVLVYGGTCSGHEFYIDQPNPFINMARWNGETWEGGYLNDSHDEHWTYCPTHWMPLPAPPKEAKP